MTFQDWDPHAGRPPSTNPYLRNNLIFQSTGLPSECLFIRFSNELGGLSALSGMPDTDFNLYFHGGGGCQFTDQRPATFLDRGTFSQWQAASNAEQHSLTSDPILTANGHLSSNSPAVDAGICEGGPRDDFDSQRRPQGVSCDVGADERTPELRVLPYPFPPPDPTRRPIPESE